MEFDFWSKDIPDMSIKPTEVRETHNDFAKLVKPALE